MYYLYIVRYVAAARRTRHVLPRFLVKFRNVVQDCMNQCLYNYWKQFGLSMNDLTMSYLCTLNGKGIWGMEIPVSSTIKKFSGRVVKIEGHELNKTKSYLPELYRFRLKCLIDTY